MTPSLRGTRKSRNGEVAETISIRACLARDLHRLVTHEPPNANIGLSFLSQQDAGDIIYATAWDGDDPSGGAVLDFLTESTPELKHLFVYPGYRGRGVGRALCEWIECQARQAGHRGIQLGVAPENLLRSAYMRALATLPPAPP